MPLPRIGATCRLTGPPASCILDLFLRSETWTVENRPRQKRYLHQIQQRPRQNPGRRRFRIGSDLGPGTPGAALRGENRRQRRSGAGGLGGFSRPSAGMRPASSTTSTPPFRPSWAGPNSWPSGTRTANPSCGCEKIFGHVPPHFNGRRVVPFSKRKAPARTVLWDLNFRDADDIDRNN